LVSYSTGESSKEFFCFAVDDMIFFRKVDLYDCVRVLDVNPDSYSLHLKLSPGIYYSHTNDKCIKLPKTFKIPNGSDLTFLKYRRSETELDWNYPFDFCGSIYAKSTVENVVAKISDQSKILKPNTFESAGNIARKTFKLDSTQPCSLCLNFPVTTVITINKVSFPPGNLGSPGNQI
jgi:hypothetical protein